jgi:hypothetical protein
VKQESLVVRLGIPAPQGGDDAKDWYYMRLKIHVTPRRIRWWPDGDMSAPPEEVAL